MRRTLTLSLVMFVTAGAAQAAPGRGPQAVTVFLDRDGEQRPAQDGDPAVTIPAFGGGDRTWHAVVDCVRAHYAPFQVDIVDTQPTHGTYITAVVGGLASQLGLDDQTTNGVGPYDGKVIPDAVVHVFSRVGTGERDVENVCAVTAHEVGHALGLDHEYYCGDIMSYFLDQCGARKFVDADAACGEAAARACGNGERGQNSYRQLAQNVGLRATRPDDPPAVAPPVTPPATDPWASPDDSDAAPAAEDDQAAPAPVPMAADDVRDGDCANAPVVAQRDQIRAYRHARRRGHGHGHGHGAGYDQAQSRN